MTKTLWCVFRFIVLTAVHLQNVNAKFCKVGRDTIQVKRKTLTFLYDKLTQDNAYQILSQLVRFCKLYIKKHFDLFFGSQWGCVGVEETGWGWVGWI